MRVTDIFCYYTDQPFQQRFLFVGYIQIKKNLCAPSTNKWIGGEINDTNLRLKKEANSFNSGTTYDIHNNGNSNGGCNSHAEFIRTNKGPGDQ